MRRALVALATFLCFGCETVRPRPAAPAPPPLRVALAEPILDLWVEGAGGVEPAETEEALSRARAALGSALDGRGFVAAADAGHLLVVREQAVTRTTGRRQQQAAAVAGIVLLVVAVVVLVAIASRGNSRSPGPAPVGGVGGAVGRAAPPRLAAPLPRVPLGPPAPWFGWSLDVGFRFPVPVAGPPVRPPEPAPTLEGRLGARGFFAGDETELVLELRDLATGATVWARRASGNADPRDPAAVRALLDRAAWDQAWAQGTAPPA